MQPNVIDYKRMSRRELLKLSPLALAGCLPIDGVRTPIAEAGLRFSDWASGKQFRMNRMAETFPASEVAPFEAFPYNYYDVLDPEVDLESWTLTVEGDVAHPREYSLDEIKQLPKI